MIWKCGKCWCTASHGLVGTQAHVLEESNGLAALLDVVNGCYCKAVNAMLLDLLRIKERWQQQGGGGMAHLGQHLVPLVSSRGRLHHSISSSPHAMQPVRLAGG
jgi:hypothetical protein